MFLERVWATGTVPISTKSQICGSLSNFTHAHIINQSHTRDWGLKPMFGGQSLLRSCGGVWKWIMLLRDYVIMIFLNMVVSEWYELLKYGWLLTLLYFHYCLQSHLTFQPHGNLPHRRSDGQGTRWLSCSPWRCRWKHLHKDPTQQQRGVKPWLQYVCWLVVNHSTMKARWPSHVMFVG